MITRITRGVLDVDREAEVFESLRTAAASRPQLPGLVGLSLSRMFQDRVVVLVSVATGRTSTPWRPSSGQAGRSHHGRASAST